MVSQPAGRFSEDFGIGSHNVARLALQNTSERVHPVFGDAPECPVETINKSPGDPWTGLLRETKRGSVNVMSYHLGQSRCVHQGVYMEFSCMRGFYRVLDVFYETHQRLVFASLPDMRSILLLGSRGSRGSRSLDTLAGARVKTRWFGPFLQLNSFPRGTDEISRPRILMYAVLRKSCDASRLGESARRVMAW